MKFKIDENLPTEAAAILRESGFDAETVWDENLSGSDDHILAARVRTEGQVLLTLDLDFANIGAYPPHEHPGIIVLRLKRQDKATVVAYVRRIAAAVERRSPAGRVLDCRNQSHPLSRRLIWPDAGRLGRTDFRRLHRTPLLANVRITDYPTGNDHPCIARDTSGGILSAAR